MRLSSTRVHGARGVALRGAPFVRSGRSARRVDRRRRDPARSWADCAPGRGRGAGRHLVGRESARAAGLRPRGRPDARHRARDRARSDSLPCSEVPVEIARAVAALRLATPGAIAAGPVIFERLDWALACDPCRRWPPRPRPGSRRVSIPSGPSWPSSSWSGSRGLRSTRTCSKRSTAGSWRLPRGPVRADELREALSVLLGCDEGPWAAAMRAAVLLGENGRER